MKKLLVLVFVMLMVSFASFSQVKQTVKQDTTKTKPKTEMKKEAKPVNEAKPVKEVKKDTLKKDKTKKVVKK